MAAGQIPVSTRASEVLPEPLGPMIPHTSPAARRNWIFDRIGVCAPGAPTIDLDATSDSGTLNDDNLTNDTTPLVKGVAEAGAIVKVYAGATLVAVVGFTLLVGLVPQFLLEFAGDSVPVLPVLT